MSGPDPVARRRVLAWLGATTALGLVGCSRGQDDGGRAGREDDSEPAPPDGTTDLGIAYGAGAHRRGRLLVPSAATADDRAPVLVLVPGGFWRSGADPTLLDAVAVDAVDRGWAAWRIDFRPSDVDGGGWPGTFVDVAAAIDHVATLAGDLPVDVERLVVIGHSSGAALALWAAGRIGLPADAPGADPAVRPRGAVGLSAVTNLAAASIDRLGDGAVDDLMGVPATIDPDQRYLLASPIQRLPLDVPTLLVHGAEDAIVPSTQSSTFVDRARDAGDGSRLVLTDAVDHFAALDPASEAWESAADWIADRLD